MVRVHTAQLNLGKSIPLNGNVVFTDTTVKSGNSIVRDNLAPTWSMVAGIKDGSITGNIYTELYLSILNKMSSLAKQQLVSLAKGEGDITDIVLGCYCKAGAFCHRVLLHDWLVDNFGFIPGTEITRKEISIHEVPVRTTIGLYGDTSLTHNRLSEIIDSHLPDDSITVMDLDVAGPDMLEVLISGHRESVITIIPPDLFKELPILPEYRYALSSTHTLTGHHHINHGGWSVCEVNDTMSDKAIAKLIKTLGYRSTVSIRSI